MDLFLQKSLKKKSKYLKLFWYTIISKESTYFQLFSIIFAAILPYIFTIDGDFVFDDSEAITKNKDVTSHSWINTFNNDFWGTNIRSNLSHKSYRPLTIMTFKLNYILNGNQLNARNFKFTNLICHTLCCILIWLTYKSILSHAGGKRTKWHIDCAYISTLLFAVHPIHVEAVSGIVGRADILAAITFFAAIVVYFKFITSEILCSHIFLFCTLVLAAISMLCKENGVTVLGFCFCYEFIKSYKKRKKNSKKSININFDIKKDSVIHIILLLLSSIVLLYIRWMVMGGSQPVFKPTDNPAAYSNNHLTKVMTFSYIYFLNILLLIWPHWLCYDWSMGCVPLVESLFDFRTLAICTFYACVYLFIMTILGKDRSVVYTVRLVSTATLLMVIPFLPAANIFYPVGFVIAERILYIPSAGFCLLIGLGINKLISLRKEKTYKNLVTSSYMFLLFTFGLKSWHRSYDWQNEQNLFINGENVCPLNAKVHYNIAKIADAQNNTIWALYEYRMAINLYPEYYQAMNNLANLLKSQKQYREAEIYLKRALQLKKDFPAAWMNLGIVLAGLKRYNQALEAYKTSLQYRSNYPDCLYNLGNLYLDMNKTSDAVNAWFTAIKLNPKHVLAWTNLLALLDNTGQLELAMEVIPKALKEVPDSPAINFAAANIYGKLEMYLQAEKHFNKAIKLFGDRVQAIHYANLGVLYHRWKKYDLAKMNYKKSLRIDPHFKSSLSNLHSLKKILK